MPKNIPTPDVSPSLFQNTGKATLNINNIKNIFSDLPRFSELPELIVRFSIRSFAPDMALNNFERFVTAGNSLQDSSFFENRSETDVRRLSYLFSGSQYLSNILIKHPEYTQWLLSRKFMECSRFKDEMEDDLSEMLLSGKSQRDRENILKRFKQKEYLRIGLRDLTKEADTVETLEDISNVADVLIRKAYELGFDKLKKRFGEPRCIDEEKNERPCEFVIMGMGKLGGRELNFSSDIDLIYFYTSDNGETTGGKREEGGRGKISNHEFFVLLSREITRILNETSEEGALYRVDLDLRPEGKSGDIANSLRSAEIYYESWGETWERQALIKARAIGGSIELGKSFLNMVLPFIYRKYLDFSALNEIKSMKEKINSQLNSKKEKGVGNVKLGYGGIREAEFIIQSFQMVYGGREPWLRNRNSMRTLHRISEKAFLSYAEYSDVSRAYLFLRDLENRIQMDEGLQAHDIPASDTDRAELAAKMDIAGSGAKEKPEKLMKEYRLHTGKVREIYDKLFSYDLPDPLTPLLANDLPHITLDNRENIITLLKEKGFQKPDICYRDLLVIRDGRSFAHPGRRSKAKFEEILPVLINEMSILPSPDKTLSNFEKFVDAGRAREAFFELLSVNITLTQILCRLFGYSQLLSNILILQPDLFDYIISTDTVLGKKRKEDLRNELIKDLKLCQTYEDRLDALRRFKRGEELRIGMKKILGHSNSEETFTRLSNLADVYLERSVDLVRGEMNRRFGKPLFSAEPGGFALISLGKHGGRELNFGSDLDILFVYSGEGSTSGGKEAGISLQIYYTKLCEKLIRTIGGATRYGFGYRIDTRLRPEGAKGVLIMPLEGYRKYYLDRADFWERQALIKARFIAGDNSVGRDFIQMAQKTIYELVGDDSLKDKICRMKKKMEQEFGAEGDIKFSSGGIVDIEFVVQYLQLSLGGEYPVIRVTQTREAIKLLKKIQKVAGPDLDILEKGYNFLRDIESSLRLDRERPLNRFPTDRQEIEFLAKRLGYRDQAVKAFVVDYKAITGSVQGVFGRVMNNAQ